MLNLTSYHPNEAEINIDFINTKYQFWYENFFLLNFLNIIVFFFFIFFFFYFKLKKRIRVPVNILNYTKFSIWTGNLLAHNGP